MWIDLDYSDITLINNYAKMSPQRLGNPISSFDSFADKIKIGTIMNSEVNNFKMKMSKIQQNEKE